MCQNGGRRVGMGMISRWNGSTIMTVEDLQLLISMLEHGMWDNGQGQSLLDTLDSDPRLLLPHAIGLVVYAAFLLMKVDRDAFGRRALLSALAWCIESGHEHEHGPTLIENIKHISKRSGQSLDSEEIRRLAINRNYGKDASWVFRSDSSHMGLDNARANLAQGLLGGVTSRLPLTTFKGWLKRLDPQVLNTSGRALMREVFSRFGGEFSSPEDYLKNTERLLKLGVRLPSRAIEEVSNLRRMLEAGVEVQLRRHRRYAGSDGRLPRGCYSSVCSDALGTDEGTLNRELMEYVHPCIPGAIFVGDSSDTRMNDVLGHPVGVLPVIARYTFSFMLLQNVRIGKYLTQFTRKRSKTLADQTPRFVSTF
jgi:hypothetical protein